ncbi:MAG TPA: glutamate mutase L [Candidatus Dormibacteraeota bacterium]|jgi:cell division protein FtsA|nr:glutamate mutase L [Candidatus Dormibacteraeota bacterium]
MSKRKFSLLRRREEFHSHYTAIDIGTEVVKALVVKREEDRGIVIGVGKVRQSLTDMQAGAVSDIQAVIDNVDRALTEAEDMCQLVPGQAVIGIAGEQIKGFSTSVSVPRAQSQTRITQAEVAQSLQMVQRRALREAVRQMSQEMGVPEVNVKLVHSAITSIRVDGYPVSNPLNFQGRALDLTIFNTFAPLTHIGALQTIAQELDLELVATVAEPYAMARGCANDEVYELGGIFVDIGGGTTDVALVRNGGIEGTRMFALGGRAFTRRVAGELGMSLEQAEQFKLAHGAGTLTADQRKLAHETVDSSAEVLAQGVALALEDMAHGEALPPAIYLAGGGAALPEVADQLRALNWTEHLPFPKAPTIEVLRPEAVTGVYDSTGLLTGTQDITPMGLAYHAIQLDDEEDQPLGGVMRRIMRAMKV